LILAFARLPWFFASLLFTFLSVTDDLADQTWTEIRSPHFRVVTDGSAKDGRMVANEFDLFDFPRLERCRYLGGRGRADRIVWAEAVFIPSRERLDRLDAVRTMRLARIMRDVYGSLDFCEWLLARLDGRQGSSYLDWLPATV